MLRKRVIVSVEVQNGRVVGGSRMRGLRDASDPVELAQRYEQEGADEIVFFDSSESPEGRRILLEVVSKASERLYIPLTVSGGMNEVADIALVLRAGADKISINTAAVKRPELIGEAAVRFGKQCIVASIDARVEKRQIELVSRTEGPQSAAPQAQPAAAGGVTPMTGTWFRVFTHGGSTATELDAIAWARQCAALGAGEIIATGIDQEGQRLGYDLEFTARVVEAVGVPVIASGGAGNPEHMRDAFLLAGADAAVGAAMFQDGTTTVGEVKRILAAAGIAVRPASEQPPSA
jgi:imidazole glycerol-phosphate synthase subunit HisF